MEKPVSDPPLMNGRDLPDSLHVNGGDDTYSYSKNSYYQRLAASMVKGKIDSAIMAKLDAKSLSSKSNTIRLADLGCAAGPNTFNAMQDVLQVIKHKYQFQCLTSPLMPEFQVFFNDQTSNDFNTLFSSLSLKERQYFAAGVPGSFYNQLFPGDSIHFANCSYALHWLSKVPEELLDENSPAWNKGRVHYTNAPNEVANAYASQFAKDMEMFLDARGKELVSGGMVVIIMPGIPHGMPFSQLAPGLMYEFMASILMDMAKEEWISEAQVDSFNLPIYAASPEEMGELVEKNGNFYIETMELNNPASWLEQGSSVDIQEWAMHVRVAMESMFTKHFTTEVIDEMFTRLIQKLLEVSDLVDSSYRERIQLFVVLMRK